MRSISTGKLPESCVAFCPESVKSAEDGGKCETPSTCRGAVKMRARCGRIRRVQGQCQIRRKEDFARFRASASACRACLLRVLRKSCNLGRGGNGRKNGPQTRRVHAQRCRKGRMARANSSTFVVQWSAERSMGAGSVLADASACKVGSISTSRSGASNGFRKPGHNSSCDFAPYWRRRAARSALPRPRWGLAGVQSSRPRAAIVRAVPQMRQDRCVMPARSGATHVMRN